MKTIKINLYKFNELSEEAKNTARIGHIEFLSEISCIFFNEDGDVKPEYENYFVVDVIHEMEKMQTPWFFNETIFHDYKTELDNEIILNEYDFTEDGELY